MSGLTRNAERSKLCLMHPTGGLSATASRRIRDELESQGISSRELARRMDVQHSYLFRRLLGQVEFRPSDLEKIAAALDVPVTRFLDGAA